jgi:hypothetical protein
MIKAMNGGWGAMCGALAMSRDAVENRIYERKGQGVLVDTAMAMQNFSGTTLFAEAIATASGGAFVKLPSDFEFSNEDVGKKWRALTAELGTFVTHFDASIVDDEIDAGEQRQLKSDAARIHKIVEELMALMLRVYSAPEGAGK